MQGKPGLVEKYQAKAARLPEPEGPRFLPEGYLEARQLQDHPVYASMIQSLDENVGRILDKLESLGLAQNTVVIFMSDNGGLSTDEGSPTSNLPLRAGKGWLYEGGIREPMIIRWPGVTEPGSTSSVPGTSTDFFPTILEMAGLALMPQQHRDGLSLVPVLRQEGGLQREALYWYYPHYSNQSRRPDAAVRAGDFKLIELLEEEARRTLQPRRRHWREERSWKRMSELSSPNWEASSPTTSSRWNHPGGRPCSSRPWTG